MQKTGHLHRSRTDDDVSHAQIEITLDGFQIADTATQLHRYIGAYGIDDAAHGGFILGLAGKCAVQIHQMQAARPLSQPVLRSCGRVF